MSLDLARVPVRREGAEGSHFGQEFVILDPPGRILRGLNETGARIWDLIDGTSMRRGDRKGDLR